jgi:putative hemolysin
MILFQLILISLNAIFASAEIAVISFNGSKLEKLASEGDKRAQRLQKLTNEPARFLATIQVAITLSGFLGSAFAADNFSEPLVSWLISIGVKLPAGTLKTIAVILITLILSYLTLIFGELVPKRFAMRKSEELALGISNLISIIAKIFAPIVWFLTKSTNAVLRLLGIDPEAEENDVSEEDIRVMVDSGAKSGSIDNEEREFIQNVFEFDDLTAGEIAVHRTEVTLLWLDETDAEWDETIHKTCHNFYPVCNESVDNVVGVLYLKDYFRLSKRDRESVMKSAVKTPYFVPESVKADVLFRNMKEGHKSFAVVLDEYGGMRGIITLYDLIERLVGSFGTEEPFTGRKAAPKIERKDSSTWSLTGSVPLDDIEEELGIELPSDDFDTFSGLVFSELGTIPDDGTTFEIDAYGMHIKVTSVRDHLIESALICLLEPQLETDSVDMID